MNNTKIILNFIGVEPKSLIRFKFSLPKDFQPFTVSPIGFITTGSVPLSIYLIKNQSHTNVVLVKNLNYI